MNEPTEEIEYQCRPIGLSDALQLVHNEVCVATARHGKFNSSHEGYAVLKEEVDEMWDEIKKNDLVRSREEAVQVAAMAIRYLMDITPKV